MDDLISCGRKRLSKELKYHINYVNLHECSVARYRSCVSGMDLSCQRRAQQAAMMSYCAPLKDLQVFNWTVTENHNNNNSNMMMDAKETKQQQQQQHGLPSAPQFHAITVLRNPIDRVWSMFRFQTKSCYSCTTLSNVYQRINDGTTSLIGARRICQDQLRNHQVHNMLLHDWDEYNNDEERVTEAITNMKEFFTLIGLTEDMTSTATMAGMVFPWLGVSYNTTTTTTTRMECHLKHKNASPTNNRCGPGATHWNLPSSPPDQETIDWIVKYNQLDIQLYEAAVEYFALQKQILLPDEL